jgi:hypothetical protein
MVREPTAPGFSISVRSLREARVAADTFPPANLEYWKSLSVRITLGSVDGSMTATQCIVTTQTLPLPDGAAGEIPTTCANFFIRELQ